MFPYRQFLNNHPLDRRWFMVPDAPPRSRRSRHKPGACWRAGLRSNRGDAKRLLPPRSLAANTISHSRRGTAVRDRFFPLRSRLCWLSLALLALLRGVDRRIGPADFGSKLLELLGRQVGRVLRPRIGARPHVGHVARVDVLDDRDEVRVDLGMTGSMLLVEME